MNTDIIARWRDAINDPPNHAWEGSIKRKEGRIVTASYWERHGNWRFRDADVLPGDQWLDVTDTPAVAVAKVQAELETERMRLAACSVVALANTRESAKTAREIPSEYKSASWHDVCAAVDREMDLRESTDAIPRAQVQAAIKRIRDCQEMARGNDEYTAFGTALDVIEEYTEVTP